MSAWFLYPAMLAGLLGLAVPVLLHLMNRELPRRLVFPSIRLIRFGRRQQPGRKGLRDPWTLLARLLMLAALVLLAAGPLRRLLPAMPGQAGRPQAILLVDLSMSLTAADWATWASAQWAEMQRRFPEADWALLASAEHLELRLPLGTPPATIGAALATLAPRPWPGRHDEALTALSQMLANAPPAPARHLILLSDLQRHDWLPATLPAGDLQVWPWRPPQAGADNFALLTADCETWELAGTRQARVTLSVRNFSLQARSAKLRVTVGAKVMEESLLVGADRSERLVLELGQVDHHEGLAELLGEDSYTLDDRRHFWAGPQPARKVALLASPRTGGARGVEAFFLQQALRPTLPGMDRLEVTVRGPELLLEEDPRRYDALFVLDSLEGATALELDLLRQFVDAGGTLVLLAGTRSADNLARLQSAGLTQLRFGGYDGSLTQRRAKTVASVLPGASVVDLFTREPADLLELPIYYHARLQAAPGVRVLLGLSDGWPLLTEEAVGKGTVFVLALGLAPAWSDLPTANAFLPLMRRLVEFRREGARRGRLSLAVGEDAAARLAAAGLSGLTFDTRREPGVLQLGDVPVELNYSRAESDPRGLEDAELARGGAQVQQASSQPGPSPAPVADHRRALGWLLLLAVLAELILAHARRPTREAKP